MSLRGVIVLFSFFLLVFNANASSLTAQAEDVYDAVKSDRVGSVRVHSLYKAMVKSLSSFTFSEIDSEVAFHTNMRGGVDQLPGYNRVRGNASERKKWLRNWWLMQSFSFDQFNNKVSRKIMSARLDGQGRPMKDRAGAIIVIDHLAGMSNGERMELFLKTWHRFLVQTSIAHQAENGDQGFTNNGYEQNVSKTQEYLLRIAYSMEGIDGKTRKGKEKLSKLIEGLTYEP